MTNVCFFFENIEKNIDNIENSIITIEMNLLKEYIMMDYRVFHPVIHPLNRFEDNCFSLSLMSQFQQYLFKKKK